MMLPAFSFTHCVGVIEVYVRYPCHLLQIYQELQRELLVEGGFVYRSSTTTFDALRGYYRGFPTCRERN
uniref:Uncharacterized protein n=1 Tax=Helianthus annuus TaxID=4232 RepID=A0A251SWP9_HELAN